MNFANLRVRTRLFAGFGIICAFLVVIVLFGSTMLGRINQGTEVIVNNYMPKIEATHETLTHVNNISIALRNMMLNADPADRKAQAEQVAQERAEIGEIMARLERTIASAEGKALLRQSQEYRTRAVAAQDELLRRIAADDVAGAAAFLTSDYRPLLAEYRKVLNAQIDLQKKLADKAVQAAQQTYDNTVDTLYGLSAVILALAAFIAWRTTVSITTPVARALAIAETVAAGD